MRSSIKTDISLTNLSKLIVSTLQYTDMKQQIRKVKYPTYAFSRAQQLSDKINSFKNQKVRRKLQQNLGSLNSYRKVRGDGNCFFRALGFSYFCSLNTLKYNNCFEMINQINLACCYHDSIPKDFQKFYDHQFFVNILKSDWQSTYQNCEKQAKGNKKKALLKLFDQNPYLDFIVVLYFRAVCLKALYKYNQQFVNFMAGGEQASIRTYSEETEGISINLCSKILNITIFVFEVRKQQVHSYLYDVSKIMRNPPKIFLLFSESHYDIIESNEDIKAEQSALKKKESYYQEVNEKMFFGQCIECRTNNYVYEVSNLCPKCHQFSLTSLNDFRKDSFVRGKCSQCWYVKDDISTSFGLCRRCIQIQNQASQRRKQDQMRRQCISCSRYQNVDEQTGLCSQCLNNQMRAMNNLQSSKKAQRPSEQVDNDSIRQSNNSAKFIPPNKATIRNQNILQSTIEQLNKNAQNQLNLQQNQKPPNNSTINLGHENYTCKVCKNYQIKGLINGYCKKCAQKYDK